MPFSGRFPQGGSGSGGGTGLAQFFETSETELPIHYDIEPDKAIDEYGESYGVQFGVAVSYTHLTLPTIYSV